VFFTRPLSAAFLIAAAVLMLVIALPSLRAKRDVALQE
jgi:TctA family transporter